MELNAHACHVYNFRIDCQNLFVYKKRKWLSINCNNCHYFFHIHVKPFINFSLSGCGKYFKAYLIEMYFPFVTQKRLPIIILVLEYNLYYILYTCQVFQLVYFSESLPNEWMCFVFIASSLRKYFSHGVGVKFNLMRLITIVFTVARLLFDRQSNFPHN